MNLSLEKLKEARDAGIPDDVIWEAAASAEPKFNELKNNNIPLDVAFEAFQGFKPVGTSIGQEISQIPAALKQSFGQPLEAMGETAQVAGFPAVATALKGAIQEPEGYVSAGQRFMEPQEGEFQIAGFAPQYAPRAVAEQTGQILMSIGSRIVGAVAGGGLGGLIGGGGGAVAGAAAGAFAGPALTEAAQVVGPVALERAKNNGYTEPTDEDMAYAIVTAAGSGLLNAFGAKYLPGGEKAVGSFSKRLASSFLGEGVPEGVDALIQQVGETVETKKGIQVNPKQAIGEALIGGAAGAAATTIAAPFTPEQIAEAKITESANKEAENLVIGNDNPQGKAVLANKQKLEQEIADTKQVLQAIESTDPVAQKLKLELKEKEAILAAAQGQVDNIVESADPVAEANRQQAELAKAIVASTKTEPAKPKSAIEQINEDKASLDERAKGFGADNARQFNAQNVLRGNLTEEESVLLSEISDLNNKTRGLGWRDAAQLSEEDFSTWSKPKFTDAPQSNEDLIDLGKFAAALDARGETDKSNKVKENISKSKRKSDWTIESWQERNEETITQDEVDSLNQENADWNDSIDNTLDFLERNTKSTVKPPLTVKQSLTVQPAPAAAPVEQVVTPPVEVAPAAQALPSIPQTMDALRTGTIEGLYTMLFDKLNAGDTTELGKPSKVLIDAMPAFKSGIIKNPSDLKNWVNGDAKMREDLQKIQAAPVEQIVPAPEAAAIDRYTELSRNPKIGTAKERKALEPTVATTTFKTSRGSTYYILPDGKIRRDKYSGTTSYSDQIAFVSPENAEKIKEIRNEYEEGKNVSVEITPEVIRFRFNEKIAEVPIASQSPQEGLSPFELSGGRYPHLGDPVVTPAPVTEQVAPAEAPAPEVGDIVAVDRKNNTEFALVKGLLPERPDMFSIGIRLIGSNQPFESGGYGHNTNKDSVMKRFFEKERRSLQDIEIKNQYFQNILNEEEGRVSAVEAKESEKKQQEQEKQRQFNEEKVAYEDAISQVKIPTGKSETMRFTAPDGSDQAFESKRYGDVGIRKVTSGKNALYNVDHWHSGLRIMQFNSLSEAKKFTQAIIASGADISKKDIQESELEKLRPIAKYFRSGEVVPSLPSQPTPTPAVSETITEEAPEVSAVIESKQTKRFNDYYEEGVTVVVKDKETRQVFKDKRYYGDIRTVKNWGNDFLASPQNGENKFFASLREAQEYLTSFPPADQKVEYGTMSPAQAKKEDGEDFDANMHRSAVRSFVSRNRPISAESVETYGITLPEGYVKQGELYVYQPAVSETITEPVAAPTPAAQEDVKARRYAKILGDNAPQIIQEAKNSLASFKRTMSGRSGDDPFTSEPRLRELKNILLNLVAIRFNNSDKNAGIIAEQIILGQPNIVDKATELKPIKKKEFDSVGASPSSIMRYGYEKQDGGIYRHPREGEGKPKLGEKGGVLIPTKEDFIQAGQNIYEAGMEFGTWAKQMIQRFGDAVREFLGEVWQAVSGAPAKLNELMGYLPKKGETGALSIGKTGKLERYTDKGTIVKLAIKQEKDTPKGILSETIKIIKQRVFDGDSTPSESATKKAWGLIERLQVTNPDSAGNAEAINQLTRETMQEVGVAEDATEGERQAFEAIKQTVGATKLNNELFKYAIKLAGQGDNSMLNYLLNNELNVVGTSVKSRGDVGRTLGALEGLKSYIVQANEAEQAGFIQLAAQRFFNTTTPTEDQIAKIKKIFTAVNETKVNEEEAILDELTQVGEKVGTELVENINTQIDKASKPEVKDPMVAAITAMLKLGGTFVYKKTKNKIKAAVEKTIKGGITNYRDKLVEGAANGLETGFWKTLSSQENKPGPLGELDNAQNRELGNIVKSTLVSMKLQGTPPNTKMSIYEQVASILGEKPLSKDKTELADKKIREEINNKRESELKQTEDEEAQDAINLKYDEIEKAWDMAMSRQLDMPVGDAMLRRLIFNEIKEAKTTIKKLATLMNEDPTIGTSRQDRIVSAIINKIAGVTFEGQNPADYTAFKEYLSNELESLVIGEQTKKRVVKTKEKVKANQALSELNKLAKIQSDTPNFPTSEKVANPVRDAVRNALKLNLNPMFDSKAAADIMRNWKKEFTAELQQLGVDEATALMLTDVVGRQIELDSVSRNLDSIDNAINKGALTGVINAIKNTPLADQQKPNWRYEVMRDYLRNAGLSATQAERIAKLMDISLQKRFAKAQEEAAASITKKLLKGIKPESNRGFMALIEAIRAQVLNPGSNVAMEFGRAMGWKGFTAEQLKALNEFDSKINDETITDAERAVALEGIKKIIDKVSLPTKVREAISAFYIGNALGRFTVATVQVVDPIIFSMWDAAVASARNVTSPSQVMQIWGNFGSSLINAGREFAFSFKNDITRSGRLVDYLETQDRKLKRILNDANNLWKSGQYKEAIKKYLIGYADITSRVLKALDDASFSLLEQNALNQYMISAMNMAKIPKKKQLGTLRMIAQARQMDIADMMANGISKNDAIIYANERMKATISNALSGLNLNSTEIIDSAINDSLSRIGKTRFKEQFSGETELKDEGTLSYPFLKIYELTSQSIAGVKGAKGEIMRIFQRMLFGFPLIVARVANVAYGYTPLSIYRHAMQKKFGNYPLTYGTAIQRRKRLVEQLAGTAVLLPLLFLRSMSFDDDEEKPVRVVITGFGPVRSKDPEAYNQWNKKHNPGSLEIFIGDKRYAIDSKSAGPLKPMIEILGAIDDWQIRRFQDNAKMTKEELKKAQENAGLLSTLGQIAGSFALTAARRGPATGLMQGLIDFRRYPDDPIAAIAQETSFSLLPLIPVVGFGATKNISDALSEPIDTRTKEGAILNNLPIIGPMFGKPAINAFGQPIGDVEISEKIKKSIGIPITLVPVSSGDDAKLAKITLKNANGPEPLQRSWFDKKFETPLSDQEWRTVNEDYARSNRKLVLENYEELNGFDPEVYKTAISNVGTQSKYLALDNLDKSRKKP